jgi:hypothetical protein
VGFHQDRFGIDGRRDVNAAHVAFLVEASRTRWPTSNEVGSFLVDRGDISVDTNKRTDSVMRIKIKNNHPLQS